MSNVFVPERHDELIRRIESLQPDSARQWGRMTPGQAVCHLSDAFRMIFRDQPVRERRVDLRRRVMRFVAFTLPFPWPKGVQTTAEMDAEQDGTPPADFEADVAELKELLARFVASDGRELPPHFFWGPLSRGEWGRYTYRHLDHHLRQFGV